MRPLGFVPLLLSYIKVIVVLGLNNPRTCFACNQGSREHPFPSSQYQRQDKVGGNQAQSESSWVRGELALCRRVILHGGG